MPLMGEKRILGESELVSRVYDARVVAGRLVLDIDGLKSVKYKECGHRRLKNG